MDTAMRPTTPSTSEGPHVVHDAELARSLTTAVARVVVVAEVVAGAVLVADRLMRRPPGPRLAVTMGPGGWVSVKGGQVGVRSARRPWARPRRVVAPTVTDPKAP